MEQELLKLASSYFSDKFQYTILQGDGSDRKIYRFSSLNKEIIGVSHSDLEENLNFIFLSEEFKKMNIPVPSIYKVSNTKCSYLMEDLGPYTLADKTTYWAGNNHRTKIVNAYKKVIDWLIIIQNQMPPPLNQFLQTKLLNNAKLQEDLDLFTNYFLEKTAPSKQERISIFSELKLLLGQLAKIQLDCIVMRDFQSRNMMWRKNNPIFIDYQSAMLGTKYYDLASTLYSSRSGLLENERQEIINYFYQSSELNVSHSQFIQTLYNVILIRRLRSLGTYVYLYLIKGKKHFFNFIKPSIKEVVQLLTVTPSLEPYKNLLSYLKQVLVHWPNKYNI